jgi:hypothetical protein
MHSKTPYDMFKKRHEVKTKEGEIVYFWSFITAVEYCYKHNGVPLFPIENI